MERLNTRRAWFILAATLGLALGFLPARMGLAADRGNTTEAPQTERIGGGAPAPSAWAFSSGLNGTFPISDLMCPTSKTVCFVGTVNQVLRSTDGGKTFYTIYKTDKINPQAQHARPSIWFVDSKTGYAGIAGTGHTGVKTTDGGENWKELNEPAYAGKFTFFDKKHGISAGYGAILYTSDQGKRWSPGKLISSGRDMTVEFKDLVFTKPSLLASSRTKLTALIAGTGEVSKQSYLFKTSDGGKTWNVIGPLLLESPTVLAFKDANRGWFGTASGKVYGTRDGGTSWQWKELLRAEIKDIDCLSVKTCYALTSGSIHFTEDEGKTWAFLQPISVSQSVMLEKIYLIDRKKVLIGGFVAEPGTSTEEPIVAYTNNGGILKWPH